MGCAAQHPMSGGSRSIPDIPANHRLRRSAAINRRFARRAEPATRSARRHLLMRTATADVGRKAPLSPTASTGPRAPRASSLRACVRPEMLPPRSWIRSPPLVPAAPAGGLIRPLSWRLSPSPSASGSSSTRWPDAPSGSGEAGHPAPSRRSSPAPGRSRQGRRKPSPVKKLSGWTTCVPRGRGAPTERAGLSARSGFLEKVRRFW